MIVHIRHRGLRLYYEDDDRCGINVEHARKINRILTVLDHARNPAFVNIHHFRLHPLKGAMDGFWSVTVRANWRIIFRFENDNVTDVDLIDYH